ncbi:MAG: nucleotidyltransferase domain-containing protein [Clostridium sp.]|uniref:nucleotidyltransferase domain-containing protein n=1 Tax=Clostridium sp. TaxID=1506 RepID=UPI003F329D52
MKEVIKALKTEQYDFLQNNDHLGDNIILLTVGGSHAYGTNVNGSDIDIRGIAIERPCEIIGLSSFEQFENRETDTVIYGLRKVISLMQNCNPNVIEMLGTKEDQLIVCNKYGRMLTDNIDLFLSKRAIHSFGGYATAQLRRLQNALARDSYPQKEKEQHILNSINSQLSSIDDRYKTLTGGNIDLFINNSDKEEVETEIFMNINLNNYPLRDFKNIYSEMSNIVKDYGKINHRNKKKDDLHLNKHAMHLIRLLIMGKEILDGKGINTYREKERDLLLDIRAGKYTFDEIFKMVDKYESDFKEAVKNTKLPAKPDYNKIEELVMNINREVILNANQTAN